MAPPRTLLVRRGADLVALDLAAYRLSPKQAEWRVPPPISGFRIAWHPAQENDIPVEADTLTCRWRIAPPRAGRRCICR